MGELAVIHREIASTVGLPSTGAGTRKRQAWRRTFLRSLRRDGLVTFACDAAGVSMALAYKVRAKSPRFAEAWGWAKAEADERICDELQAALYERGMKGHPEPVFYRGELVGYRRKPSTRCLILLLQALDPRYRRNASTVAPAPLLALPRSCPPEIPELQEIRARMDAAEAAASRKLNALPTPPGEPRSV